MINRKLIKYAIAYGRITDVARAENWGVGSGINYQFELADDYHHYALGRAGLKKIGWRDREIINKIIEERSRRRKERGISGRVTDFQKGSAYGGLVSSEFDRFDMMTENRFRLKP